MLLLEYELVQPLWKTAWRFLRELKIWEMEIGKDCVSRPAQAKVSETPSQQTGQTWWDVPSLTMQDLIQKQFESSILRLP
jgi:hypothetical protein